MPHNDTNRCPLLRGKAPATRPGARLVGDITYLPTQEGWLYLACWLDLATREVIGYAMPDHHCAELVVDAVRMAHARAGRVRPERTPRP